MHLACVGPLETLDNGDIRPCGLLSVLLETCQAAACNTAET